jgi:ABC-type antimicrobial peptide transport system permease subunit
MASVHSDPKEPHVFRLRYLLAELRRRRGRTILTALGLGVGVGLVIAVSALSAGLDEAQDEVLEPLTGVGTDMSVNRPISFGGDGSGMPQISASEQRQLRQENGGIGLDFADLGEPGETFKTTDFISTDISFDASQVRKLQSVEGVEDSAPSLTVQVIEIEGTVPESTGGDMLAPGTPPAPGGAGGAGGGFGFDPISVTGIETGDDAPADLGPVTAEQLTEGEFLSGSDEAMVSSSYAASEDIAVGETVEVAGKKFEVTGITEAPIGGDASDIYMDLTQLQKLSDREGRVSGLEVRADDVDSVDAVATAIESEFEGAEVTTASELSDSVSGSLVDAKNLSETLGTALAGVSLVGAFAIASLLTLSAVNKRTREIGTLKALGWRRSRVVSQITGESVAGGLIGGGVGAIVGVGIAALIGALGISLEASAEAASTGPVIVGPGGPPPVEQATSVVTLGAPVDPVLILAAAGLAVLGGLVAGSVGGLRAARMQPAEALRSVE